MKPDNARRPGNGAGVPKDPAPRIYTFNHTHHRTHSYKSELGALIRATRIRKGMTQADLAVALGSDVSVVRSGVIFSWETTGAGLVRINDKTVTNLATFLGINKYELAKRILDDKERRNRVRSENRSKGLRRHMAKTIFKPPSILCSFSSFEDIPKSSHRDKRVILATLKKAGRFSAFEATSSVALAETLDSLAGYYRVKRGPGFSEYPWLDVEITPKGEKYLREDHSKPPRVRPRNVRNGR